MDDAPAASQQWDPHQPWTRTRSNSRDSAPLKRSLAGNLFSKLTSSRSSESSVGGGQAGEGYSLPAKLASERLVSSQGALSSALQHQRKTRRRKSSLRKTALLWNGLLESKVARGSSSSTGQVVKGGEIRNKDHGLDSSSRIRSAIAEQFLLNRPVAAPRYPSSSPNRPLQPLRTKETSQAMLQQPNFMRSDGPANTPRGQMERSTDDEDSISLPRRLDSTFLFSQRRTAHGSIPSQPVQSPQMRSIATPSSGSDSYVPTHIKDGDALPTRLRAGSQQITAPLAVNSAEMTVDPEAWDYSETEWWGWIILIVTWLVFVIGMGSCLGVWSWAWDVGETPYAPPELEDDPTLPIVGYYPALMTLTAVMAWVWVMIAWVGMKYFRHAKISGEEL